MDAPTEVPNMPLKCARAAIAAGFVALVLIGCAGAAGPSAAAPASSTATVTATSRPPATARPATPAPTLAPGVLDVIDTSFRASGILAAGDFLWAEDHAQTSAVYAVDPDTGEVVGDVPARRPCDIAAAAGYIWVAEFNARRISAIDPATFEIVEDVTDLPGPCGLQTVDGTIWVAIDTGLARVDPATKTAMTTDVGGAVFPGAGTPLWGSKYGSGDLVRVDIGTAAVILEIPSPGGATELSSVAAGFGSVWVGNDSAGKVFRLDGDTGQIQAEIASGRPSRLLVTTDALWVTSYETGTITRIDPSTNEVGYRAKLGGNINGITEGWGAIWVSDTAAGLLYRIDPEATGVDS